MRLRIVRLWHLGSANESDPTGDLINNYEEQARAIGLMIRQRREVLGLTLRDLAAQIRITTPVIEALERGWTSRLPERTYLASMLPQIEQHLKLPAGCLKPVLPAPAESLRSQSGRGWGRFTIGSIDVFTTWQGSLIYGAMMLLSLLAINRQRQDLALRNALSLEPVRADVQAIALPPSPSAGPTILERLRPLEQARRRTPQYWLKTVADVPNQFEGVLQLMLKKPHQLKISSRGGDRLRLAANNGTVTLQLEAPIRVSLTPPANEAEVVFWNGTPLLEDPEHAGLYRVEAPLSSIN
ncbi:helix-turn-helix transcriptional regulator [Synechococcus sp. M16CYN]|uniref:helix-turn-helix domain-containing protein n=1 Tax=Synechococcus sp. M16CYN TaxID=3103139 RepID=UPI0032553CB6